MGGTPYASLSACGGAGKTADDPLGRRPWGLQVLAPTEIFDGTIAMALDPQGPLFALFAGEVEP